MYINPKITFTCVTYNRVHMLRNLLTSFVITNNYDNFEWLIMEHDTNDGTVEFLKNLHSDPIFDSLKGKIKIFYESDKDYVDQLKNIGFKFDNPKQIPLSFFGKFRNDLIKHAQGEILIDLPDDHQFIYSGDYCQHIVDIFNDRIKNYGRDDIGKLTFRTRFQYRLTERKNPLSPVMITNTNIRYFEVINEKRTDDWGAISRKNFNLIGGYSQLENEKNITEELNKWNSPIYPKYYFYHWEKQQAVCKKHNLKKIMTKIPIMHDCIDNKYASYARELHNRKTKDTVVPIITSLEIFEKTLGLVIPGCVDVETFELFLKISHNNNKINIIGNNLPPIIAYLALLQKASQSSKSNTIIDWVCGG
jgi:hypothetical protein